MWRGTYHWTRVPRTWKKIEFERVLERSRRKTQKRSYKFFPFSFLFVFDWKRTWTVWLIDFFFFSFCFVSKEIRRYNIMREIVESEKAYVALISTAVKVQSLSKTTQIPFFVFLNHLNSICLSFVTDEMLFLTDNNERMWEILFEVVQIQSLLKWMNVKSSLYSPTFWFSIKRFSKISKHVSRVGIQIKFNLRSLVISLKIWYLSLNLSVFQSKLCFVFTFVVCCLMMTMIGKFSHDIWKHTRNISRNLILQFE